MLINLIFYICFLLKRNYSKLKKQFISVHIPFAGWLLVCLLCALSDAHYPLFQSHKHPIQRILIKMLYFFIKKESEKENYFVCFWVRQSGEALDKSINECLHFFLLDYSRPNIINSKIGQRNAMRCAFKKEIKITNHNW